MLLKSDLLKKPPTHELIDRINATSNLAIRYDRVQFSAPIALDPTHTEITVSTFVHNPIVDEFIGSKTIRYHRYALADHLSGSDLVCDHPNPQTTQVLLDVLIAKYDTVVLADEFDIVYIAPGSTTATLTAKPESKRWVGSVTFTLTNPPTSTTVLAVP